MCGRFKNFCRSHNGALMSYNRIGWQHGFSPAPKDAAMAKRTTAKAKPARKPVATAKARKSATPARAGKPAAPASRTRPQPRAAAKVPRLERARRTLDEVVVP